MKRILVIVLLLLIPCVIVFADNPGSSDGFVIKAFKEGVTPYSYIDISTGLGEGETSEGTTIYDVTANAVVNKMVDDVIVVTITSNKKKNITLDLVFTPFVQQNVQHPNVNSATYAKSSSVSSENLECVYKGTTYFYQAAIGASLQSVTASQNDPEKHVTLTYSVKATNESGETVPFADSTAPTLPGIYDNTLTASYSFKLQNLDVTKFTTTDDVTTMVFVSNVTVNVMSD